MVSEEYSAARKCREQQWNTLVESYNQLDNELKLEWDTIEIGHKDLEAEKKTLRQENGGVSVSDSDILDINAGGEIIRVSRGTLTQMKGTVLEAIFSGRWEKILQRDGHGNVFLDVNPECFRSIVDFLCERKIAPPETPPSYPTTDDEHCEALQFLCTAFGLTRQVEIPDSVILKTPNHVWAITDFLGEDELGGNLTLLYRGTRDGLNSSCFLARCKGIGNTLTVIETTSGYVFGGYSDKAWEYNQYGNHNRNHYTASDKAFLFSLKCYTSDQPQKLRINQGCRQQAVMFSQQYGTIFGSGPDLQLFRSASSCLSGSYDLPAGWNQWAFTGSQYFEIKEVETFSVDPSELTKRPSKSRLHQNVCLNEFSLDAFPQHLKRCVEKEKKELLMAFATLTNLKADLNHERGAVQVFCKHEDDQIVRLNVSGRIMAVAQSTLGVFPDSVLCEQFVVPTVNTSIKRKLHPVREWTSTDVCQWVRSLNCSADISSLFAAMTGAELLSLDVTHIKELGIDRLGTVALVEKSIQKLRENEEDNAVVFVEHSCYCIGKILDHLRLMTLMKLGLTKPSPPKIRDADKQRFRRIVEYFFPTKEMASKFLG
jgi:hypothetical protein